MAIDIERILELVADYHNFSFDQIQNVEREPDSGELTAGDLDLIVAAANTPQNRDEKKQTGKNK